MGTLPTRFYSNNDDYDDNKEILNENISKVYYKYEAFVKKSSLDYIKKNIKYNLYLCENDIILEYSLNKYIFIYQNINYWTFSRNTFGLFFKKININDCDKEFILFEVSNGNEIAKNLKIITKELVDYYKKI